MSSDHYGCCGVFTTHFINWKMQVWFHASVFYFSLKDSSEFVWAILHGQNNGALITRLIVGELLILALVLQLFLPYKIFVYLNILSWGLLAVTKQYFLIIFSLLFVYFLDVI